MTVAAYDALVARFEKITDIHNAAAILQKESEVTMPKGSADDRTRQIIALAEIAHALTKTPEVKQWLDEAARADLPPEEKRNLELMRRAYVGASVLPDELVSEIARIGNEGEKLHTELRKTGDWSKMKDWYQHSFDTLRRVGELRKDALGSASTYEALLSDFSPDIPDAAVAREFAALEQALPGLIRDAVQKQASGPQPIPLTGTFPAAQQAELSRRIAVAMGFDFNTGRLDAIDAHPSTGGSASDVRFTTDCSDETSFLSSVYSTVHEAGHALYEQGTPKEKRYRPDGATMGMAVHESQSGIMERNAAHTPEFFAFLEKQAREVFGRPDDPALSAENLELLAGRVEPSFIRIEADELTYPAHILLRYKLEKSIVEGALKVEDLPKAWNDGMQKLLGITPPDASKGCMQDVHWPCGMVGYFPAYALGNMIAAQLYAAAVKQHPEIPAEIGKGNFSPLREWLRDNVHGKGSTLPTEELLLQATGEKLSAKYYLDHLSRRYAGKPYAPAATSSAQPQAQPE